jgi:hypothetical protein
MKYNTGCIEEYLSRWLESKLFSGAVVQLLQATPIFYMSEAQILSGSMPYQAQLFKLAQLF